MRRNFKSNNEKIRTNFTTRRVVRTNSFISIPLSQRRSELNSNIKSSRYGDNDNISNEMRGRTGDNYKFETFTKRNVNINDNCINVNIDNKSSNDFNRRTEREKRFFTENHTITHGRRDDISRNNVYPESERSTNYQDGQSRIRRDDISRNNVYPGRDRSTNYQDGQSRIRRDDISRNNVYPGRGRSTNNQDGQSRIRRDDISRNNVYPGRGRSNIYQDGQSRIRRDDISRNNVYPGRGRSNVYQDGQSRIRRDDISRNNVYPGRERSNIYQDGQNKIRRDDISRNKVYPGRERSNIYQDGQSKIRRDHISTNTCTVSERITTYKDGQKRRRDDIFIERDAKRIKIEDGPFGKNIPKLRKTTFCKIGYMKLQEWSQIENCDDLVITMATMRDDILILLMNSELKYDWCYLVSVIFNKISNAKRIENKTGLFELLQRSKFLAQRIKECLNYWAVSENETRKVEIGNCLINVFDTTLKLFSKSYGNIPLDSLNTFVIETSDDQLKNKVTEMIALRKRIITKEIETKNNLGSGMQEKPPENFRELDIIPSHKDIYLQYPVYLRPVVKEGFYNDGEHYLDVQFRLLREDLIQPLREGIMEIANAVTNTHKSHSLKIYNNIKFIYPICNNDGVTYLISFNAHNMSTAMWKHSRRLIFGSLLCLSKDKFQTFVFATVSDRDPQELQEGRICIRFEERTDINYFNSKTSIQMVENSTYFEAYKHVLKGLKEIKSDAIPMQEYLLKCDENIKLPQYLENCEPSYNLKKTLGLKEDTTIDIKNEDIWPSADETVLNESQLAAFRHALTKKFAVIQGPPGTGKTYVSLKIADALLKNKNEWQKKLKRPLFIVCYTNHALDQFLTGLINLGHRKLIRVGGRCSDALKEYSIRNARQGMFGKHHRGRKFDNVLDIEVANPIKEMNKLKRARMQLNDYDTKNNIDNLSNNLKLVDEMKKYGDCIKYNLLETLIDEHHKYFFDCYASRCAELNIEIIEIFLGVIDLNPDLVFDFIVPFKKESHFSPGYSPRSPPYHYEDENIDVIGDGDALVNKWVIDDNDEYGNYSRNADKSMWIVNGQNELEQPLIFEDIYGYKHHIPSKSVRRKTFISKIHRNSEMLEEEVERVENPWHCSMKDRWGLYMYWLSKYVAFDSDELDNEVEKYDNICKQKLELKQLEDAEILKTADIIAMTTSGAARYRRVLNEIQPPIVIVEEAAEVLEAHVLTCLNSAVEHVILIGDHKQLKPNPSVYNLARKYGLDMSLFERMLNNGLECHSLNIQHRMRPEISFLLRSIYPNLEDHPSVASYANVKGVTKNLMLLNHDKNEIEMEHMKSKANDHEASFLKYLCLYLFKQGYKPSQITILTGYAGQVIKFKSIMDRTTFDGVRVTAIDNYQGEENDIVLLSLVRSNADGNVGFLGIDNRICVALSRAKLGMYIIGNFDLFIKKSQLWKKIVEDAITLESFGTTLDLCCTLHKSNKTKVASAEDFEKVPEGGCLQPCDFRLDCGHACKKRCHPINKNHSICMKKCDLNLCAYHHKCQKTCHFGKPCGPCKKKVKKIIQPCGHENSAPCHINPLKVLCVTMCKEILSCGHQCMLNCGQLCDPSLCIEIINKTLKCGHESLAPCNVDISLIKCQHKCGFMLNCSHPCGGTCSGCRHGRLHIKCIKGCKRDLPCGHLCNYTCTKNCPSCERKCENKCIHSKCRRTCGSTCIECKEKCRWKCRHKECSKLCHELCDREPCNEPCMKLIKSCKHPCIGLCGEPCPKLCRICNKETVEEIFFGTEDNPNARFIFLKECGHAFEKDGLDQWMATVINENEVQHKKCPRCKTIIRENPRYNNIIKSATKDIEEIKLKIRNGPNFEAAKGNAISKLNKLVKFSPNRLELESIYKSIYKGGVDNAIRTENQASLLICIKEDIEDRLKYIKEEKQKQKRKEMKVVKYYLMNPDINTEQIQDVVEEVKRLTLHMDLMVFESKLNGVKEFEENTPHRIELTDMIQTLSTFNKISKDKLQSLEQNFKLLQKNYDPVFQMFKERAMIVNAIGLKKGHWYKCCNGHYYCIGECGGPAQKSKCPECSVIIGGESHKLASGNTHAGEMDGSKFAVYSEEANNQLNWDPNDLERLRRM